jgi:hypothetical protein
MIYFRYEGGKKCGIQNNADVAILPPCRRTQVIKTASQQASLGALHP